MPTLPVRSDIELIFGKSNVAQYADADNTADEDGIDAKVTWAISQAWNYIGGRLATRFNVAAWDVLPNLVFNLVCMRAGVELYTSPRGLVDGDPANNQMNSINLKVEVGLEQILGGVVKLLDTEDMNQTIAVDNATVTPDNLRKLAQNVEGNMGGFPEGRFFRVV